MFKNPWMKPDSQENLDGQERKAIKLMVSIRIIQRMCQLPPELRPSSYSSYKGVDNEVLHIKQKELVNQLHPITLKFSDEQVNRIINIANQEAELKCENMQFVGNLTQSSSSHP